MKVKKIQEQEKINLKLQNKKKVKKLKEKGITLIALVVTIIILLILAGVTLNLAMSGNGLFSRARNAVDKYKKAQEDEAELLSQIGKEMNSEYVGAYVKGYEPTNGTYTITGVQSGTGEDQTFTTAKEKENGNELKWRIWDYDGTTLRIILDSPTKQTLKLSDANGYNYGVWAINEICRQCFGQYEGDNNEKIKEGISVANLRRSDIEKVSTYDYTNFKHGSSSWGEVTGDNLTGDFIYYGEAKSYKENNKAPTMWSKYDSEWNYKFDEKNRTSSGNFNCDIPWEQEYKNQIEEGYGITSNTTEFRQSFYAHNYKNTEFLNAKYVDMIFNKADNDDGTCDGFWLPGRCVYVFKGDSHFGIHYAELTTDGRFAVHCLLLFCSDRQRYDFCR